MVNIGYTHAGLFHADDVFSTALLKIINPNFQVKRVFRVPEDISDAIVYDIGGGKFDHHQKDSEIRENGVPYASFGLIWREYGSYIYENQKMCENFDENFIQPLDFSDNNGEKNSICSIISSFNPEWNSSKNLDDAFAEAVDFAKIILENIFRRKKAELMADIIVEEAYEKSDKVAVFLDCYAPWKNVLMPTDVKFVVFPSNRGGYVINAIPISEEDKELRQPFPEKWAGLENEEIVSVSKIAGLKFCHKGRFMVSVEDVETAKKVIEEILKNE